AEVSSLLPVAGGFVRLPHFSHGNVVSTVMGFTAWVGYCLNTPIATAILLEYAGHNFPWLFVGNVSDNVLSPAGLAAAAVLMLIMVLINIVGVRALAQCNLAITWFKILIPAMIGVAIIAAQFNADNFAGSQGFAPFGVEGILSGVATGGVMFSLLGFRHAIDLAGEVRNPQVTIPWALTLAVVICILIYGLVQVAFIGALPAADFAGGWDKLKFSGQLGPFADLAAALGLIWVGTMIYGGAIIAPFGAALVSTGSTARLALALSRNGFLYPFFSFLSQRGVPVRALVLNYILGMIFLILLPIEQMVTLLTATLVLSLGVGPLSLHTLRRQLPDHTRGFTLPFVSVSAPVAFIF
ncbi:MAG: APC family permease, partial [Alphaproteobacteria bacterium]|nr:APC family permease [Alphaproteobacteria bacterium]